MNKNLIRILAVMILISPWIYIGEVFRTVLIVFLSFVILLATVDISKKKKDDTSI